jgi:hypothetical protein
MTARRQSRLYPSRAETAALISSVLGVKAGQTYRAGNRFAYGPHRADVPDSAWHPATQLTAPRQGRSGGDDRGSAEDRRRRKLYLLNTYGDGFTVPCAFCKRVLMFSTVTVDRYPIPGRLGGRYTRDNIRPACGPCNKGDQGRAGMLASAGARA